MPAAAEVAAGVAAGMGAVVTDGRVCVAETTPRVWKAKGRENPPGMGGI